MHGCSEEVLIQGVVPCISHGSWIMMSLSSSSVPRSQNIKYMYIGKQEKGETKRVMSK